MAERGSSKDTTARNDDSLFIMVRDQLEEMILSGEVEVGARLTESTLAARFGVSRGPIREALLLLAEAGLVKTVHNRGVFVREVSLEDVLQIYDVRAGLARSAGRIVAMRATSELLGRLRDLWDRMEAAREAQDVRLYHSLNTDFHIAIVEGTGNQRLIDCYQMTERELKLFTRRGVGGPSRADRSNREHLEIFNCIADGDERGAAEAFENHTLAGKQRMLDSLSWRALP